MGHLTAYCPIYPHMGLIMGAEKNLGIIQGFLWDVWGKNQRWGKGRDQGGLWRNKHGKINEGLKVDGHM